MTKVFFGTKQEMTEAYLGDSRVAVTRIAVVPLKVSLLKSSDKDGYQAAQVVFGRGVKHPARSVQTHLKAAGVKSGTIKEIPFEDGMEVGSTINFGDFIKPGTVFSVQGRSKGKGFAGVVKRWGFAGGFKTHGQSDRHRAPGSIGQGTTPGRVHRGKKMAGRMGSDLVTLKGLTCVYLDSSSVWVVGPVPGPRNSLVRLTITSESPAPELTFLKDMKPVPADEAQEKSL